MSCKAVLFVGTLAVCAWLASPYPIHASCQLTWTFSNATCMFVETSLKNQMETWSGTECGDGEKCRYKITHEDPGKELDGTHTTPKHMYVDDLTMKFTTVGSGCSVAGHSTSETWYAVLDYGTNYCNLHSLVTGAGLNSTNYGYAEKTGDSECTQYSSADCSKY